MKKIVACGLAALIALLAVFAAALPAQAAGPNVTVKVSRDQVRPGQLITVTAHASVRCQWLVVFAGVRQVRSGKRFTGTFTAPAVTATKRYPATATCFYPGGTRGNVTRPTSGRAERLVVRVPARKADVAVVTVLPLGPVKPPHNPEPPHHPKPPHGGPGGLPNTGGPNWWLLLAGFASLAGGSVLVRRTTRRVVAD